jgi:hypothetical protein
VTKGPRNMAKSCGSGHHWKTLQSSGSIIEKYGIRICLSPLEDHPKSIHLFWVLSLPLPLHHQAEGSAKAEGELYISLIMILHENQIRSKPIRNHSKMPIKINIKYIKLTSKKKYP